MNYIQQAFQNYGSLLKTLRFSRLLLLLAIIMSLSLTSLSRAIAVTPPTTAPVSNIHYGLAPKETLDVWPSTTPNSPLLVLAHDGGWWTGDKGEFTPGVAPFLQAQGFTVVNVNYRLDSAAFKAFPMEIDDVVTATQWAINHATQYNADPNRVTLIGYSAGGHLVAMASQRLNTATNKKVKAVITLSALTDIPSLAKDQKAGTLDPRINKDVLYAVGCNLTACTPAQMTQWSPARNVTADNCPSNWVVFNSSAELAPMDQPNMMTAALNAHGCKVTKVILSGNKHSTQYWPTVRTIIANSVKAH